LEVWVVSIHVCDGCKLSWITKCFGNSHYNSTWKQSSTKKANNVIGIPVKYASWSCTREYYNTYIQIMNMQQQSTNRNILYGISCIYRTSAIKSSPVLSNHGTHTMHVRQLTAKHSNAKY